MTKQLFNGFVDGSIEPEGGCEAIVKHYAEDKGCHMKYWEEVGTWWEIRGEMLGFKPSEVYCYLPIPPHDKLMTTGSTVLETNND